MLKIAIVDDENSVCSYIEKCLIKLSKENGISTDIDVFYSGEEIKSEITENYFDVIFLDIKMKNISGIDVSHYIRNTIGNEATQIIYISGNTEYAIEVFDYDPFHFLSKPLNETKIEKVFLKLVHKLNLKAETFKFKIGHDSFTIPIKDIFYFQSDKREIYIYYKNNTDVFYGTIDNIRLQLEKYNFLLIHNRYLVNSVHIRRCTYDTVEMSNNAVLPIAQSKRKEIREKQFELLLDEET